MGFAESLDVELRHFLINWTEGDARSLGRGADLGPAIEQWRALAN